MLGVRKETVERLRGENEALLGRIEVLETELRELGEEGMG